MFIPSYGPIHGRNVLRRPTLPVLAMLVVLAGLYLPLASGSYPLSHSGAFTPPSMPGLRLPLYFEANGGQVDSPVKFLARTPGGLLSFTSAGIDISLRGIEANSPVSLRFVGANEAPALTASEALPGRVNYLKGDPATWRTGLLTYARITYTSLFDGIDLMYEGQGEQLKGTYLVAPGADPSTIRWRYGGAHRNTVDAEGNLRIALASGSGSASEQAIVEQAPVAWQEIEGRRVQVSARYQLAADGTIGFALGTFDPAYSLTIDPALVLPYSTYLGGSGIENGNGVAVDGAGYVYVAGATQSADFPTANQYQADQGGTDAFVAKLNTNASGAAALVYATYLGGSAGDQAEDVEIDGFGNPYVVGYTDSDDFPTEDEYQADQASTDAFIARLDSMGSGLLYSSYLGGSDNDYGKGIAVDAQGRAYISGYTLSDDFPTKNQYQTDQGDDDPFVAKFDPDLSGQNSLVYSTYLGGSSFDQGARIAVDGQGNAYVTGFTASNDFPTRNEYQTNQPQDNAFLAKLDPTGSDIAYSTYLGGSGMDFGTGVDTDDAGHAYVSGYTSSTDFPTKNEFQGDQPDNDVFVTRLDTLASGAGSLVYSTYLGGDGYDDSYAIAAYGSGQVHVTGGTSSTDFPKKDQYQDDAGFSDAFVSRLDTGMAGANSLVYSTYLGGDESDLGRDIAVDLAGSVYVAGDTTSTDFPAENEYQADQGDRDAFVSRLTQPCTAQFPDVPPPPQPGSTFYSYVRCLACRSIIGGFPDGTFRPNSDVTRGQLSKIVANAAGFAEPAGVRLFEDVPENNGFFPFIQRLANRNILGGYACRGLGEPCVAPGNRPYFRPNANASRGQISKIVANAASISDPPGGQIFTDVPPGSTFYDFINRLTNRGVMSGYTDPASGSCTTGYPCFRPERNASRGQVAKIVSNTFYPNCQTPTRPGK